jgi:hypothetical protein
MRIELNNIDVVLTKLFQQVGTLVGQMTVHKEDCGFVRRQVMTCPITSHPWY